MPTPSPRGSLLNAPEYADRVNLIKKIKVGATWRFAPVVPEPNGRLKDKVRINGAVETHTEGAYYIEWRERGKRCRVSVAREDAVAVVPGSRYVLSTACSSRLPAPTTWLLDFLQAATGPSTIAMLVAHYRLKELAGDRNGRKAFSTHHAGETTVWTGQPHEAAYPADCKSKRHSQTNRLAYLPSQLRHLAESERGRCEDGPGAFEARE